jgi:hypothetical protein
MTHPYPLVVLVIDPRRRRIREAVLPFAWNNDDLPKTVREYRERYKGVSQILDVHPEILEHIHEDLKRLSSGGRKGRNADFSSETILRALGTRIRGTQYLTIDKFRAFW